mmetsp:Transcript_11471/g.70522  ORF Transcript_11471/g.70522 Transcript_11471/m.70522 type:complete len:113 (+) Transcript_11471:3178-3516(+)
MMVIKNKLTLPRSCRSVYPTFLRKKCSARATVVANIDIGESLQQIMLSTLYSQYKPAGISKVNTNNVLLTAKDILLVAFEKSRLGKIFTIISLSFQLVLKLIQKSGHSTSSR